MFKVGNITDSCVLIRDSATISACKSKHKIQNSKFKIQNLLNFCNFQNANHLIVWQITLKKCTQKIALFSSQHANRFKIYIPL